MSTHSVTRPTKRRRDLQGTDLFRDVGLRHAAGREVLARSKRMQSALVNGQTREAERREGAMAMVEARQHPKQGLVLLNKGGTDLASA